MFSFLAVRTTVLRDIPTLFIRRSFWYLWAGFLMFVGVMFFSYFEDFLEIQPELRAKNLRYGVTDLVIVPYCKLLGWVAMIVLIALTSRAFYWERYAPFSVLIKVVSKKIGDLIWAKCIQVLFISSVLVFFISLPIWVTGIFYDYNAYRVFVTLVAVFVLLLSAGMLTMVLSLVFSHSVLLVLLTVGVFVILEVAARLWVDPVWLSSIISYFSPISHVNRIATGVIFLSDFVFFVAWFSMGVMITYREFGNSYLTTD